MTRLFDTEGEPEADVRLTLTEMRALLCAATTTEPIKDDEAWAWDDGYGPPLLGRAATEALDSAEDKLRRSVGDLA